MDLSVSHDLLFYALYGPDWEITREAMRESAERMGQYTQSPLPTQLWNLSRVSATHARVAFAVLLSADEVLREQITKGTAKLPAHGHWRVGPMCPYKAGVFFRSLYSVVIEPWARHECNEPYELVQALEELYLVS